MRTLRAFVFASGLASLVSAAPSFSASLTPAQRERLGLSGLSAAQLAELDTAVAAFQAQQVSADSKTPTASSTVTAVSIPAASPLAVPAGRPLAGATTAAAPARPAGMDQERLNARVVGEFRGWNGGTYFPLDNGQVWRQVGSESNEVPPRRDAVVEIYPSGNGYWRLRYEGAWITVRRLQ